jgi:hypothetical protein
MHGMTAQDITLLEPQLVRSMIIEGTPPPAEASARWPVSRPGDGVAVVESGSRMRGIVPKRYRCQFSLTRRAAYRCWRFPLARKAVLWGLAGTILGTAGVAESDSIR